MASFKDPMAETLKTDLERQGLRMESPRSTGAKPYTDIVTREL